MSFIHASKCKVLLVDDSRELLRVLEQLLKAEGFYVKSANNLAEALERIEAECFHVAVVDVRLDERDPSNRDGLQLMRELRSLDPSTGIIILTIHADLDVVREALQPGSGRLQPVFEISRAPASEFLEKTPQSLRQLPNYVQKVFEEVVQINWSLKIVDAEGFMGQIPRRLRIVNTPAPAIPQLKNELEELVRKLFSEWEQVDIRTIDQQNQGYSKAFVFQVTPYSGDGAGALLIAKVGDHTVIEREVLRYREFIERRTRGNRNPAAIMPVRRTRTLGGMIYTFIGLDGVIRDFAQFYHNSRDFGQIASVIENLFTETLALQHGGTRVVYEGIDLRTIYTGLLRLDEHELQEKYGELLDMAKALHKASNPKKFWLQNGTPLVNPIEYALHADFKSDYVEATIHGDLHAHNVLVDRHHETWLIDFANTGKGPLLQDYIAFEASLLVENNECQQGRLLFEWARVLFGQPGEMFPELPLTLAGVPELAKAHAATLAVRRQAFRERIGDDEQAKKTYLIGLFFTTLRMTTVKFLSPIKRFHALTLAALIAENLMMLEKIDAGTAPFSPGGY